MIISFPGINSWIRNLTHFTILFFLKSVSQWVGESLSQCEWGKGWLIKLLRISKYWLKWHAKMFKCLNFEYHISISRHKFKKTLLTRKNYCRPPGPSEERYEVLCRDFLHLKIATILAKCNRVLSVYDSFSKTKTSTFSIKLTLNFIVAGYFILFFLAIF